MLDKNHYIHNSKNMFHNFFDKWLDKIFRKYLDRMIGKDLGSHHNLDSYIHRKIHILGRHKVLHKIDKVYLHNSDMIFDKHFDK